MPIIEWQQQDSFSDAVDFLPELRHGAAAARGSRNRMEDRHRVETLPWMRTVSDDSAAQDAAAQPTPSAEAQRLQQQQLQPAFFAVRRALCAPNYSALAPGWPTGLGINVPQWESCLLACHRAGHVQCSSTASLEAVPSPASCHLPVECRQNKLLRLLIFVWTIPDLNPRALNPDLNPHPVPDPAQVFDGHNGAHAAEFASDHLLEYLVADEGYPAKLRRALVCLARCSSRCQLPCANTAAPRLQSAV